MGQAFPGASLLRDFGLWLQSWSEFALAQAAQSEATAPVQPIVLATTASSPPEHWIEATRSPGPPDHWLALLRAHDLAWQPETGITALSAPAEAQLVTAVPLPHETQDTATFAPKETPAVGKAANLPPAQPLAQWLAQLQEETAKLLTAITDEQHASSLEMRSPQSAHLALEKVAAEPMVRAAPDIEPVTSSKIDQHLQPQPLLPTDGTPTPAPSLPKTTLSVTHLAATPTARNNVDVMPDDGKQPTAPMPQAAHASQPAPRQVTRLRFSTPMPRTLERAPTVSTVVEPTPLAKQPPAPTGQGSPAVRMTQMQLRPAPAPPTRSAPLAAPALSQPDEAPLPQTKASGANSVTPTALLLAIEPPELSKPATQLSFPQPTAPDQVLLARVEHLLNQVSELQNRLKVANSGNEAGQTPPPNGGLADAIAAQTALNRWPTLPEIAPAPQTQRHWHQQGRQQARRQRVDREQRGQAWNA